LSACEWGRRACEEAAEPEEWDEEEEEGERGMEPVKKRMRMRREKKMIRRGGKPGRELKG
jgi:hypothetical protein